MGMVGSDEPQTLFDVLHDSQHVLSESRQRQCRKLSRNSRNAPPILALPMTDFPAILLCENCVSLCTGMIMFAVFTPDFVGFRRCPSDGMATTTDSMVRLRGNNPDFVEHRVSEDLSEACRDEKVRDDASFALL